MPRPYPIELRERVVHTYLEGNSTLEEVAIRFCIAPLTVHKWVCKYRKHGHVRPLQATGGKSHRKVMPIHLQFLMDWLGKEPDLTNVELAEGLMNQYNISVSPPHISRVLIAAGFTRKKNISRHQNAKT